MFLHIIAYITHICLLDFYLGLIRARPQVTRDVHTEEGHSLTRLLKQHSCMASMIL